MAKAIVTGHTGFLGNPLFHELRKREWDVIGVSRRTLGYSHEEIQFDLVYDDLNLLEEVFKDFKPEYIFHYAANPLVRCSNYLATEDNVISTHKLLDITPKDCFFIFASSATVYGKHENKVSSTSPTKPSSVYALNKLHCENLIKLLSKQRGFWPLILRYVAHTGKSATHGVCYDIVRKLKSNSHYLELYGNEPGSIKPFLYIDDSINKTIELAETTVGTVTISPSDNIAVKEIANIIMEELNIYKPIQWTNSTWLGDDEYVDVQSDIDGIRSSYDAIRQYARDIS